MRKVFKKIIAAAAALLLAAYPAAGLAQVNELTWTEILNLYPEKPIEELAGTLRVTTNRSWQEARDELADQELTVQVFSPDGLQISLDGAPEPLCTGQFAAFHYAGYEQGVRLFSVVIKGDVRGSGNLNITQLTRMADAITNRVPLEGVYEQAGDINGNGEVDIMDLVVLASWLRGDAAARTAEPLLIMPDSAC